jgi:hypothetical protein
MIRAALASLALFLSAQASAQITHIGEIMGGPSKFEFIEYFDDGYTGEPVIFGKGGEWEGSSLTAHTIPHVIMLRSGNKFVISSVGAGASDCTSNFGPVAAGGFNISCVATANEGVEIYSNVPYTGHQPIVLGVDPDAEFCATVNVGDHDGFQVMTVGWRRWDSGTNYPDDAVGAVFGGENYTDMVSLGVYGADTAGAHDVKIGETLNDAVSVVTDTTDNWSEATDMKFCTRINSNGSYSQTLDGSAPTATAASPITLDTDNEWYIPFLRFQHDGTANITSFLVKEWEVRFR